MKLIFLFTLLTACVVVSCKKEPEKAQPTVDSLEVYDTTIPDTTKMTPGPDNMVLPKDSVIHSADSLKNSK
ncbi:hypothetical protein D1632_14155 [Chryseobacterium nematophagum]|uniref:Uncharacterized protein n=1 Tax=Chryseobacterium nematophagum TaxID=2305228 RepID=A0A3M7L7K4_9FLAO|nr:hypothetical protein D1632_14155 [Chryseobacterium nematophagum]